MALTDKIARMTQQKTTTVTPSIDSKATPRSPTVSASNDVKAEAVREPPCQNTKMFFPTTNHWISSFFGVYSHHSGVTRTIQVKHGRMQVSEGELVIKRVILPSAWLRLWGVSITCMRRNLGWEYLFTPIRVVSDCSPIFRACREGDIHEVISLLNNSQATLQDTSEWGWSLLHVSLLQFQSDKIKASTDSETRLLQCMHKLNYANGYCRMAAKAISLT